MKIVPTERVRTGSFCVPRHSGEMAERCGRRGELEPSGEICGKTAAFLHTTFGLQKHRTHGGWYLFSIFLVSISSQYPISEMYQRGVVYMFLHDVVSFYVTLNLQF